jgi:hypothetical protein
MLFAVLVPEWILGWAVCQFFSARRLQKRLKEAQMAHMATSEKEIVNDAVALESKYERPRKIEPQLGSASSGVGNIRECCLSTFCLQPPQQYEVVGKHRIERHTSEVTFPQVEFRPKTVDPDNRPGTLGYPPDPGTAAQLKSATI